MPVLGGVGLVLTNALLVILCVFLKRRKNNFRMKLKNSDEELITSNDTVQTSVLTERSDRDDMQNRNDPVARIANNIECYNEVFDSSESEEDLFAFKWRSL